MFGSVPVSRRAILISGAAVWGALATRLRAAVQDQGSGPCAVASPHAVMAPTGEPGPRMLVRGRLFAPDGERPASGTIVYAYQTDATGVYNKDRNAPPRLRAFLKTDAEYETIRPGSYPGTRNPAHVHHQAWGGGWPAQWVSDLNYADDAFVSAADRARSEAAGRFAWVLAPRQENGVLVVDLNLRLKAEGTGFEASIRHGREACGLS